MSALPESVVVTSEMHASLESERASLLVVGRPLTPAEQERVQELDRRIAALGHILEHLTAPCSIPSSPPITVPDPAPVPTSNTLIDGRYEGGNHELFVELRVDEEVSGVVSADLYRSGITGRSYVASIRTTPGMAARRQDGNWQIIGTDEEGRAATGKLTLVAQATDGSSLTGTLFLDTALTGLPVRTDIHFAADHASARMRGLGIELEQEQGIDELPAVRFEDQDVTVRSCLEAAGFDVHNVGAASNIPVPNQKWGTAQLHALMIDFAQAQLTRPAWELHLLILSESSRDGLFGIMFDSSDPLPRQGSAVFAKEIQTRVSQSHFPRKIIQTTVHELGHALNLAHRFERSVGRADSTSFMNYDWRYRSGNHATEFWSRFEFTFDADELEFLRHAARPLLIPGGAPFHSVNYWSDGNGGYSPYVPEVPISFLGLTLRPPSTGTVFKFAQPVFLEIELENLSDSTFNFTPEILDPKSGLLEVLIRRRGDDGSADVFRPIIERCFDISEDRLTDLAPGESINNNLNLTFGSAGFPFAEPGEYDVTALLVFFDRQNQRDLIVRSNTLRLRIRFPENPAEENDAMILLTDDVGLYFVLGGSSALTKAHEALETIRDRRQGKRTTINDPIVANIVRCAGIDAGRSYQRYEDGKFRTVEGDHAKSAEFLEQLTPAVLRNSFDAHTASHTELLAKKHRKWAGNDS